MVPVPVPVPVPAVGAHVPAAAAVSVPVPVPVPVLVRHRQCGSVRGVVVIGVPVVAADRREFGRCAVEWVCATLCGTGPATSTAPAWLSLRHWQYYTGVCMDGRGVVAVDHWQT